MNKGGKNESLLRIWSVPMNIKQLRNFIWFGREN